MLTILSKEMLNKGKQAEKYKIHVATEDFYKHYCYSTFKEKVGKKSIIHRDSKFCVSRGDYGKIISDFNSLIAQEIILDNFEYKMPARMGVISIKKKKPKIYFDMDGKMVNRMPIDWKATKDLWAEDPESKELKKLVRHTNEHTQGYIPYWSFNSYTGTFKHKTVYKFIATRTHKRFLTTVLKDPNIEVNYYLKK
jgi:hypothetical protein